MLRRVRGCPSKFTARLFAKFEAKYEPHLCEGSSYDRLHLPQLYHYFIAQ
jgi:hypothetical protein